MDTMPTARSANIRLRAATLVDTTAIVRLCKVSLTTTYGAFMAPDRMRPWTEGTEVEDYVAKMWPRTTVAILAHEVVGRAVRQGVASSRDLAEFTLDELRAFSPLIEADVFAVLTLEGSVAARDHLGGTAPAQVRAAAARARARLDSVRDAR